MEESKDDQILLPHHEQETLCTTRLPYRQGRKLTAVKVYSITKESNHLLIFGVPSLNLRQETKLLFTKIGKLLQFNVTTKHASEPFTETYHAQYDKIQPARVAKRMLDTKNFYGGILHVCYAPEFETIEETRQKLIQRQHNVIFRLKNLKKEITTKPDLPQITIPLTIQENKPVKLNMGQINTISYGETSGDKKKKNKRFKLNTKEKCIKNNEISLVKAIKSPDTNLIDNTSNSIDVVDCTNVNSEVITNINESLNFNSFGNEVIRRVPVKPLNKIIFNINKKT